MTTRSASTRRAAVAGLAIASAAGLVAAHVLEPSGIAGQAAFFVAVIAAGVAVGWVMRLLRARARAQAALHSTEELFRSLMRHSSDAALVLEEDSTIRYVSPVAKPELSYEPRQLVGTLGRDLIHPDDLHGAIEAFGDLAPGGYGSAELRIRDGDGEWRWVEEVVTNLLGEPAVAGMVVNIRDISVRKEAEIALEHLAHYDRLTGLPNRGYLTEHLAAMVQDSEHSVALLIFDLDKFKFVNDSRGHLTGDRLLQAVAQRLAASLPVGDIIGRWGGDEFAVICLDVADSTAAKARSNIVLDALQAPFEIVGSGRFYVSASVGIACADENATPDQLLQQADTAMYAAKDGGRGQSVVFDERLRSEAEERLTLEADLMVALDARQLIVHYQPVLELATSTMVGVEALVRWRHPTRGLLAPGCFIPVAEQSVLIERIDAVVLRQACEDAAWWARAGSPLSVAVNISAAQLCNERLAESIRTALYDSGLAPDQLVLEITETSLLVGAERALTNVDALRMLGVHVALDDFGTGYSSLAYLKRVPADIVKIDRSFIEDIADSAVDRDIVAAVIDLAGALGKTVIAEGIETDEQFATLRDLDCPLAQGWLWSASVPAEDILTLTGGGPFPARSERSRSLQAEPNI